jgi:branched-chain amino acid transport system ATP-binding protein
MSSRILLELNGVTKSFGGVTANNNVSFEVKEGQIVGLIGPNGAGKTTMFSLISGFIKPDRGSVKFDGRDITGIAPEKICKLGLTRTYQVVKPFKDMTVLENVMVGAFSHTSSMKKTREIALDVLEITGLIDKKDLLGRSLTIADKKRLELSRALATRPKLLLLDEVMAGLTPVETQEAVELIRKISKDVTLLIIEHVMEVIMPLSDHVIVLDMGQVIARGLPHEIAKNDQVIKAYLGEKAYAARH